MNKLINCLTFILTILMICCVYIPNFWSLILCGCLIITIFALRNKLGIAHIVIYLITLSTCVFRLSVIYNFNNAIVISKSYVFLTQAISALIGLAVLVYNYFVLKNEWN